MAMNRALMNTHYLQSKIAHLHGLHNRTVSEYGELVSSLTEECQTLCDIIPSYKISATLEGESGADGVRKKKEVYAVEKLEHEMLTQYEHFLQLLRKLSKKSHPEQQALGSRLTAKLVSFASEFNHCDRLLSLAVDFANSKVNRVAIPCLKALSELLDGQTVTEATDCVVGALLAIVRKQAYAMNPAILNVLLHIRVAMIDMHRKDFTEEKAKEKKMKKEDKELARQMQKAKGRRDRSEVAAKQTKIVHRIFVIYLRIIQSSSSCTREHQARILAPTLEGLVKFAPLVNTELFHLLMKALQELMKEKVLVSVKLHALVAVASLAAKDAMLDQSEWKIDLAHFHEVLFASLPEALAAPQYDAHACRQAVSEEQENGGSLDETSSQGSTSTSGSLSSNAFSIAESMMQARFVHSNAIREWSFRCQLVLRTVDLLILSQKHLPIVRVTAFVRRLLQYLPLVPPHIGIALTALCYRILQRYPQAASVAIGGSDNIVGGRGVYNPEATTTMTSHSECSFAWETALLHQSFHPIQRKVVEQWNKYFLNQGSTQQPGGSGTAPQQLNLLGPYEVLETYDTSFGEIKPAPTLPSVLSNKGRRGGNKRIRDDEENAMAKF